MVGQYERSRIMANVDITLSIDEKLKNDIERLCENSGISLSIATGMIYKQLIDNSEDDMFTFYPSDETLEAIEETERMLQDPNTEYYPVDVALKMLKEAC